MKPLPYVPGAPGRDLVERILDRSSPRMRNQQIIAEFPPYRELLAMGSGWNAAFLRSTLRRAVHAATAKAIREGRLARPEVCDECRAAGKIEGHHDDYDRPLSVRWLCTACHRAADAARRRRERHALNLRRSA